jgi:hypothetical protein
VLTASQQTAIDAVVFNRLSELITTIDDLFERLRAVLREFETVAEDSETLKRRIDVAVVWANFLYDDVATATGYFGQTPLGPDADVLLKEVEALRRDIPEYGKYVGSIFDENSELPDRSKNVPGSGGNTFLLRWEVLVDSYRRLRSMFETIRDAVETKNTASLCGTKVDPELRTFLTSDLCKELDVSSATINTYAKKAGIPTPRSGQRNYRYTGADRRSIYLAIISKSSDAKLVQRAREQVEQKSKARN